MLKSFILQPSILSTCFNTVAKRTLFNTSIIFEKQQVAKSKKNKSEKATTTTIDSSLIIGKYGQKRARVTWTEEETERLKKLVDIHGFKYSLIAKSFPNRRVPSIYNRCRVLYEDLGKSGAWTKEELECLEKLTKSAGPYEEKIDWKKVQSELPYNRAILHIKITWNNKFNPRFNHGRWQPEEINKLKLATKLIIGDDPHQYRGSAVDWHNISDMVGTRSSTQCLERFRWQESPRLKGSFTPEEDKQILEAVKKYGDGNFLLISEVINSSRSPRSLSQRYRYALDPNSDRSPWTLDEEMKIFNNLAKYNGSMIELKKAINSKRNVKDMWNHYKKMVAIHNAKKKKENGNGNGNKEE